MKTKHVIILIVYIAIDQIVKLLLTNKSFVLIPNFLNIEYVEYSGKTMFGIINSIYFILLGVMLIAILYYNLRIKKNRKIATPIIIIIASTCANIIDKMLRGYVVDYISLPAFGISCINISDIIMIFGIIALVFVEVKYFVKKANKKIKEAK